MILKNPTNLDTFLSEYFNKNFIIEGLVLCKAFGLHELFSNGLKIANEAMEKDKRTIQSQKFS